MVTTATMFTLSTRLDGQAKVFHLLALDSRGAGYDRILICRSQNGNDLVASASLGDWSNWAMETFQINGCSQQASVRFKLLELTSDGSQLKLYRTQVTYGNDELAAELIECSAPTKNTHP